MKKSFLLFASILFTIFFVSCASLKEIPEDKTSAQIIQMGQNEVSYTNYKSALFCYETAIERFGTNPAVFAEARYEIGHVYLKQKKYEQAYEVFTELIELYDSNPGVFSASYKKLAKIGISKIPAKKITAIQAAAEN